MSKALKIALGVGIFGGILYGLFRAGKAVTESISYQITGFDAPIFNGQVVTLPIFIAFKNATPVPIPVSRLQIFLSYQRNGQYYQAGTLDQKNITLEPGESTIKFTPQIDLKALFNNVLQTLDTIFSNKSVSIKADITVTVAGATVTDTVYKTIPIRL